MAHNTNFTASDAAICGVAFMVALFVTAAYGILTDIFRNHWMWFLIDVSTCGIVAVLRGMGYFFGWIIY